MYCRHGLLAVSQHYGPLTKEGGVLEGTTLERRVRVSL
jgi:hypothetical protein